MNTINRQPEKAYMMTITIMMMAIRYFNAIYCTFDGAIYRTANETERSIAYISGRE